MNKKLVDQLSKELTDLEKATKRDNLYSANYISSGYVGTNNKSSMYMF